MLQPIRASLRRAVTRGLAVLAVTCLTVALATAPAVADGGSSPSRPAGDPRPGSGRDHRCRLPDGQVDPAV